jgi:hypothetical protein
LAIVRRRNPQLARRLHLPMQRDRMGSDISSANP